MRKIKSILFWLLSIFYMEMILKASLFDDFLNINIVYVLLFSIPIAIFIYLIATLFTPKINKVLMYIILSFITIIYMAQLIYYKTYLSIFSVFSMTEADQLLDYVDTIIKIIIRNWLSMVLLLGPLVFAIVFNKKYFSYKRGKVVKELIFTVVMILFQVIALLSLNFDKKDMYSVKELYYYIHSPTLSTSKLGLLTTMRLDFKRLFFGFEGKSRTTIKQNTTNNKEEEKPKIEYNVMNIDFDTLISGEKNATINELHNYFKNVTPTNKNEYTGLFKGKNLIVFLAESFHPIAIDEHLTPTLYKLSTEGFRFTNFYTPLFPVSTSDGEYMTVTSLLPKEGVWSTYRSSNNYWPFVLGNSFKAIGYKTTAYHDHRSTYYYRHLSHPNFGYDFYACGRGLKINCKQWPESDLEMIDASYSQYMDSEPYLTYYVTVSGHLRYNKYNNMSLKNWDMVKDLTYSTSVKAYLAANIEFEKAITKLISYLEEKGELANTVIAISGDHYPYGLTLDEMNEKASYPLDDDFEKHHMSFLLWNSETKGKTVNKLASSIDILPTLLNLFGQEYDSRLLMGRDIFSDSEPIVIFSNRSFITDKGRYNSINAKFYNTKSEEMPIDKEYLDRINNTIYNRFYISTKMLEKDYYRKVFPQ